MSEADFVPFPPASEAGGSTPKPQRPPKERKERKDRAERTNTTLFISSLPYTATSTDLITHFSYLGPVRHGFIATDKASGQSKGVGYVTYALKEDADQAVAELDNKEFGADGRKIRVQWAAAKPDHLERRMRDNAPPTRSTGKAIQPGAKPAAGAGIVKQEGSAGGDPNAIRTLVLSGIPDVSKAVLWKRVRKVHEGIELRFPISGGAEGERTAHLVFPTHNEAIQGIAKIHGHTYKGSLLSAVLKKRIEKLESGGKGGVSHAGRLIVRNLAWDVTEQDLRATFLPYGPIQSVDLPKAPSKLPARHGKEAAPRARGFAFVWYLSKGDAEKALEGANGKPIVRAGALANGKGKGKGKAEAEGEERVVAVDWALSKEKWAEQQGGGVKKEEEDEEMKDEVGSEGSEDDDDDDDDDDDSEASSDGSETDSEDDDASDGHDDAEVKSEDDEDDAEETKFGIMDVDEEEAKPAKPKLPTVDVGSTLFIRNLPFEVTEQELNTLFRSFGPLRYAKITMDKVTGRSRGTGFVCYWKTEHADAAIAEAERVHRETGAIAQPIGSKNPFALPSVLSVDPSSSLASRLVIQGRTLDVSRAVTREQAGQMKEDGDRARHAGDKRNTYLMREGVIFPNSPAAADLPAAELEKRQAAFNARRTLLRSNPSLYISKTRLSIRQLPLFVTDRVLKRLAIHAIRAFDSEVKAGTREALSRIEESDETLSPALAAREAKLAASGVSAAKGKPKPSGRNQGGWSKGKRVERDTPVIQSKVVRSSEKVDPLTNLGRSRGYGFLEMRSHKDALKVLRWANNNAEVGKLVWEWWKVEMGEMLDRARKEVADRKSRGEVAAPKAAVRRRSVQDETDEDGEGNGDDDGARVAEESAEKAGRAMLKGKHKETLDELEARVRKLEDRTNEGDDRSGGGMRGGKTLMIEFSIENVQVVRRRVDRAWDAREDQARPASGQKRKAPDEGNESDDDGPAGRPTRGGPKADRKGKGNDFKRARKEDERLPGRDRVAGRKDEKARGGKDKGNRRDRDGTNGARSATKAANGNERGSGQTSGEGQREKKGLEKLGDHLGSLIGRKRKMRKSGR